MKKLANNYTTIEQSKRLLELGLLSDSADLFYHKGGKWVSIFQMEDKTSDFPARFERTPCWSVGRLVEIHRICSTLPDEEYMFPFWKDQEDNVEWAIRVLESGIRTGNIDFSKLEEV